MLHGKSRRKKIYSNYCDLSHILEVNRKKRLEGNKMQEAESEEGELLSVLYL